MRQPRTILLFVSLCVAAGGAAADEKEDPTGWTPAVLTVAAPGKFLSDLRSPIVEHEVHVATGASLAVGSGSLVLELTAAGRTASWRHARPGKDGATERRSGSLRLPGLLPLTGMHGMRYPLWIRAAPAKDGVRVGSAYGAALLLGGATAFVVDSDRDGVLGSKGDGLVAPESRTVGPWRGEAWGAKGARRYRRVEGGGWESAPMPVPHPQNQDHTAAWRLLQWRRQQCGLLTVEYDASLEADMRSHARYAARTGQETHEETPGTAGYTKAGDEAGRSSIIGWDEESMLAGLSIQLATMYHRTRVLQPGLTHTALVLHEGVFMLNVFARRGGPLKDAVLVYPPHGMDRVRSLFHRSGESPMPTEERPGHLGTAVSVFSEPLVQAESLTSAPTLVVEHGRRRKPVEGAFHYPGHPPGAAPGISNRGNVSLVPSLPLRPRTDHACATSIPMPDGSTFTYEWTFRTRKRPKAR